MRNTRNKQRYAVFRQFGGTAESASAGNAVDSSVITNSASGFVKVVVMLLLALGILIGSVYAYTVYQKKNEEQANVQSLSNFDVQSVPLTDLVDSGSLGLDTSQSLSINGQLRANNSLILTPGSRPQNGTVGQIYYDKDGQYLAYYNGAKFVNIAGTDAVDELQAQLGALQASVSQLSGSIPPATTLPAGLVTEARNNVFTGTNSFNNGLNASGITAGSLDTTSLTASGATLLQGALNVNGVTTLGSATISSLILSSPLGVNSGGTGVSSLANNEIVIGQGAGALATVGTGTAGLCLMSTVGAPSFQACPGGVGSGVNSLNGLTGALTLNNASGAGATITIDDASTAAKGIASFNASNFSVTNGAVNTIQDISVSSTPTFAGLNLTAPLAVGSGGTGANSFTSNGVVIGQGSASLGTVSAAGAGMCLVSTVGAPVFQACPGAGGVSSVDSLTGALNINNTTGTGSTITIDDASTTAKGIASFNAGNFSVTGGVVNTIQNIGTTSSPLFNALTLSTSLTVSSGGTGASSFTANGLLLGQGSSAFSTVTAGSAGLCLVSTAGAPVFQACPGAGGVTSLNGLSGVLNLNNASGSGSSVTIDDASTSTKGIASFNSGNFTVTSGAVNTVQNISTTSSPTFSALTLTTALGVANGGTGVSSLTANGVLLGQGSSGISAVTASGAGQCLVSTAGAPVFQACPGAGGVASINGLTGAVLLNNSSAAGSTVTIDDATTTTKGIASFNGTNFTVTAGAVNTVQNIAATATPTFGGMTLNGALNGQTISNAANFTGSLTIGTTLFANTITPSGAMSIGSSGQVLTLQGNASTALSATNGGNTTTLAFQSPTANVTYRLQTAAAGTYDVCTTAGNCVGVGGGVTTAGGTTGRIAKFTGTGSIGDSLLSESGSIVTVGGTISVNDITSTSTLTVGTTAQTLILQGDASTRVSATSGGITNSLLFATPAGSNKSITLPNASGTLVVSASGPLAIDANGNISCATCALSGSGVTSVNGLSGALTVANASGAGSTITIDNASTAAKGIASFNSGNFTVTNGAVNTIQDISVTSSPTFNALSLTTALSVANGGTGATTASGARTNLGAAASDANSDITSLSGLTTALSIAQGGTGATTSQAAINNISQLTTAGDLLYYDGTNSTRLARGANGECLTANASTVVWGSCGLSAEADTLATVTGRGALTTTAVQLQGGAAIRGLTVDTATGTDDRLIMAIATGGAARFDGTVTASDLTAGRTWTLPNASGTIAVSATGPIVLDANGNISCPTCGVAGSGVTSVNGLTGALTVANATGFGATITIDDASTSAKGIASFNSTNFSVSSGAVNTIQDIATTSSPTFNALTLTTALSVTNGGTGATTAPGARTNLGAAASGANSDITSLSGLTTALSIAQGGTGGTTSQAAINNVSQLTTAGDLLYYDGTNSTRLARGTNGQCLTSNATTVVWGACGAGEADTLATVTARGSSTTTAVQLQGGAAIRGLTVDTATATDDQIILAIATGGAARFDGTITAADLTANRTWTLPNASGTIAVSATGPIVLDANGNISCPTCTTGGGGAGGAVDSLNGLNGTLTIANASGSGSTITIDDASTSAKGIASFNAGNFTVTNGAVNTVQNIATTSSPTFNALTLTTALSVANGGTGANTAAGARTNLGAAASGANSDITSLSGLTTALSTGQGGTGATTTQGAINNISQLTTNGDLLYHDGTNSTRLARGTNGQCLTSNISTIQWGSCGLTAEADTLATVTARGATTSTAVFLQGGATVRGVTVDSATATEDIISMAIAVGGAGRFTGTITNADLTSNQTYTLPNASGTLAVSASGNIALSSAGNITFTGVLPVTNGGTGANTLTTNGVIIGNGTSALSAVTAGGAGQCLVSTAGAPTFQACPGSGGVSTLNGLSGAVILNNATAAGSNITIDDASTTAKGIASFNSTNFTVTSGAVNTIQDIATTSSPTFNALSLTTALSVANGGTGASTAAGARTNLGAAASGANSDITSLSGLTTALSIAQGGTGATTSQGALNNISQLTTNGDLLYYNGTNSTRLARGANGQCLTSDASTILWGSCGLTAEADTLATVTSRGSTTSTGVALQGGAVIRGATIDTATATDDKIALSVTTGGAASFTGAITSADLTAARTWTLPDESGTLCVQGSTNCGFATSTGSGSYIQNQNSAQQTSANFWISGTGRADIALQAPTFDAATAVALNIGTTNATSINLNQNTTLASDKTLTVQGTAMFKNATDSTAALRVQNAAGTITTIAVDTVNNKLTTGNLHSKTIALPRSAGVYFNGYLDQLSGQDRFTETGYESGQLYFNTNGFNFLASPSGTANTSISTYNSVLTVGVTGSTTHKTTTNSATAFRVLNNVNTSMFNVDTTGSGTTTIAGLLAAGTIQGTGSLTLGTSSAANGTIILKNSTNANTITLTPAAATANRTVTFGDETGTVCIQGSTSCGFALSSGSGSYINNQNASQQATSNFWISGTGRADTALQAPTFDAAIAGALTLGGTNATSISVQDNVTLAAGLSLTVTGGNTSSRPATPTEGMVYYDTDTKQLLTYANGKWQADRSTATKIVAASNSSQALKDGADYVATGTSDQTTINSALTAAAGGKVYLAEGTYTVSGAITLNSSNTTLVGSGSGTIIKLVNGHNVDVNIITINNGTTTNVSVMDLAIDGNKTNQTAGVQQGLYAVNVGSGTGATATRGLTVSGVEVKDARSAGIILSSVSNGTVKSTTVRGAGAEGVYTANGGYNSFENVRALGNTGAGLRVNNTTRVMVADGYFTSNATGVTVEGTAADYYTITNSHIVSNTSHGVSIDGAYGANISSNHISSNTGNGIHAAGAPLMSYAGLVISNNSINSNTGIGISFNRNVGYASITGNRVYLNGSYGIALEGYLSAENPVYNTVTGNHVYSNAGAGIYLSSADRNTISSNNISDSGGSTTNNGIQIASTNSTYNNVVGNAIVDSSATTNNYAINIGSAVGTYLADNTLGGGSIVDGGTNTVWAGQQDSNGTFINKGNSALTVATSTVNGTLSLQGGMTAAALSTPVSPTLATVGTAGTTSYSYTVTALDGSGETLAPTATTITTGNATLSGTNYNTITWTKVTGATSYRIYRTAGGATQGLIGTAATSGTTTTQTFNDTGLAASGTTPTANTTGGASFAGALQGGRSLTLGTSGSAAGTLIVKNATNANTITVTSAVATTNRTVTLGDESGTICLQNSASCGFAATAGGTGYIQNQNASQQATSNFWISGTGRADTALQAPTLDTATATALAIGGTNATSITLQDNVNFNFAGTISAATPGIANTAGYALTVQGGQANGSTTGNAGGALSLIGGAAAGSGNNNGGVTSVTGGTATGTGTGGAVNVTGGYSASGTSGNVNISGGGNWTSGVGNGGNVTISGGHAFDGNGGNVSINPGCSNNGFTCGTVTIDGTDGWINILNNSGSIDINASGNKLNLTGGYGSSIVLNANASSGDISINGGAVTIDQTGNLFSKLLRVGAGSVSSSLTVQGGLTTTTLPAPGQPTVTQGGTAGATSYTYAVAALDGTGETVLSTARTTTTGNASLSGTDYNTITWTKVNGATGYRVYRTAGGATQGLIVSTSYGTTNSTTVSVNDTGLAASGSTPTSNTTGGATFAGVLQGGSRLNLGSTTVAGNISISDGSSNTVIFQTAAQSGDYSISIPALAGNDTFCLQSLANCGGGGSGVTTVGAIDGGVYSANGASIAGTTIYLQTASATQVGLVNTGTQTFAGDKTFNGALTVNDTVVAAGKSLTVTGGNTASRPASPVSGMVYYDTDTKQLMTYTGTSPTGKWQADRTDAVLVAASNSSQADKDAADYVADGNTGAAADGDQVQINAALTAAAGKKVILLAGTYVADATILVPNSTTLAGVGVGTVIELADLDAADRLIENSDTTTGTGVVIRDMKLDGRNDLNTAGNQAGIALFSLGDSATYRAGGLVTNVTMTRFRNDSLYIQDSDNTTLSNNTVLSGGRGISLYSTSTNNTVTGNKVMNVTGDVFSLYGSYNTITGNTALNNSAAGFYVGGSNFTITGNTAQANVTGLTLEGSYNTVSGNTMIGNGDGIYVTGTATTGNVISNNVVQGSTGAAPSAGITIYAHSGDSVTSNTISGGAGPGIKLIGSGASFPANNNLIANNTLKDNGGATTNDAIYLGADADSNTITGNSITDASATTNNYAINISSATDNSNYLADNTYSSGSINDLGTGTIHAGQVSSAGNYILQPAGTIQLMKDTSVAGNLNVTSGKYVTANFRGVDTATPTDCVYAVQMNSVISCSITARNDASFMIASAGNFISDSGNGANQAFAAKTNGTTNAYILNNGTIVGSALQAPSLDAAGATALTIGNTNATAINIGNTSSNITTTITGNAVIKPSTGNDSTTTFQVQNAAGSTLIAADTLNSQVALSNGTDILLNGGNINSAYGGLGQYGNLLTKSEWFDNASWVKTSVAVTADSVIAPNLTTTADNLATTVAGGSVYQTSTTAPTNDNYTFSVWLKTASGTQAVDLRIDGATTGTGTAKTVTATTSWQRFWVTQNTSGFTGNIRTLIFPGGTAGSGNVDAWGAQLNKASDPSAYGRTYDGTISEYGGLITQRIQVSGPDGAITLRANDGSSNNVVLYSASGELSFYAGQNIRAILRADGRMGIGLNASSPGAQLEVTSDTATRNLFQLVDNTAGGVGTINVLTVADEGAATFRNRTNSTAAFQVQNAAGTALLTADTANNKISIQANNNTASISATDLFASSTFTASAGWTPGGTSGIGATNTHASGTTGTALTTPIPGVAGTTYEITFNITGYTSGTVMAYIGGAYGLPTSGNGTGYKTIVTAYDANNLTFYPSTDFVGTITGVTVKPFVDLNSALNILNGSGATGIEVRATGSNSSTFIGVHSGKVNSAANNTGLGFYSLRNNTTGAGNSAFGESSLSRNVSGGYNTAVGSLNMSGNYSGSDNSSVGYWTFDGLTTGSRNVSLGNYTGYSAGNASDSTYIGYYSGGYDSGFNFQNGSGLQNATAIGAYSIVQSSNSIVLGSVDSNTKVGIGTTKPDNLFSVSPVVYSTGTASQSGTAVTGSGTTWGTGTGTVKVGMKLIYANGTSATITAVNSNTSLTVDVSQTVSGQNYRIHSVGFQVTTAGEAFIQNTSTGAFKIQDQSGAALLTADTTNMTITVQKLVITTSITVNGHIISGGSTPTIAAGAAACTTPTVSVSGTDTAGIITVTTGTGCAGSGKLGTITFATSFAAAPRVTLTPAQSNAAGLTGTYVDSATISTTAFDLSTASTPASSTTYKWYYHAIQ